MIPGCNPNYNSKSKGGTITKKTPVFRLPTDKEECATWLKYIPLKKEINTKTSALCERHWPNSYATVSKKGKLRPKDPPSVWPEHPDILPPSCRPKPPPIPRPTTRSSLTVRGTQPDDLPSFLQQDRVTIEVISERVLSNNNVFYCPTTAYNDWYKLVIQSTARCVLSRLARFGKWNNE